MSEPLDEIWVRGYRSVIERTDATVTRLERILGATVVAR